MVKLLHLVYPTVEKIKKSSADDIKNWILHLPSPKNENEKYIMQLILKSAKHLGGRK